MINLKNVSKFYYKKGIIATGITKVNLQLDLGEFVVITGESGSGKSTLLNVISGLDSYEEGEMYIDGRETSHFVEKDFVEYRKKYIGNIFQNFNLINSYTVYQNVELILLINGFKRSEIKNRVKNILGKVGLEEFAGTKVSKLSGGQKQRVAIARALAKETDIIVADEPTGNLDSQSAKEIVELLRDISRDKLLIVVTHNFEQFEAYATRQIKMYDGRISDDVRLKPRTPLDIENARANEEELPKRTKRKRNNAQRISGFSKIRLGIRNTFNVVPKFVLLFVVFMFMLTAVTSEYTSYLSQKETTDSLGYNSYFSNLSMDRMVLKKSDGSKFTDQDYKAIKDVKNVKSIAEYDVLLDSAIYLESGDFYFDALPKSSGEFAGKLANGRMPKTNNEIILTGSKDNYYFSKKNQENLINKSFEISLGHNGKKAKLKVVGTGYKTGDSESTNTADYCEVYMADSMLQEVLVETYRDKSDVTIDINGKIQRAEAGESLYNIVPSSKIKKGETIVSYELDNFYTNGESKGRNITVTAANIYYKHNVKLKIVDKYTEKNLLSKTGLANYDKYAGAIFVNQKDYDKLFTADNYQATVYVNDRDSMSETKSALKELGFDVLPLKDVLVKYMSDVLGMIQLPILIIVVIALFFISYFVIRLILRSRSGYFSILRMLGLNRRSMRRIMDVELITMTILTFGIFIAIALLSNYGIITIKYVNDLIKYMNYENYAILLGVLLLMSYMISGKFTRSLFKKSAMGAFREGE